jgi:hypothetical protein
VEVNPNKRVSHDAIQSPCIDAIIISNDLILPRDKGARLKTPPVIPLSGAVSDEE